MPLKIPMIRPAAKALAAALLAAVMLAGCQTSQDLVRHLAPQPAQRPNAADGTLADIELIGRSLDAPPAAQASLLASAEQAYQATPDARRSLRLALLLATPGAPGSDLPRAQTLLQGLLADPKTALLPPEQTLARLELVLITRQLTLQTENRTLRSTGTQQLADFNHQLRSAAQQNASLKRQLGEARAKLAAITNIEKSMNEGKLGNEGPPP